MKYVILSKEQQEQLLRTAKDKFGVTWNEFARELGIHRSMIFFYLRGESRMPLHIYELLTEQTHMKSPRPQMVLIENKPKNPRLPNHMSKSLAEFLGILAGDGHMTTTKYLIDICADKDLDRDYIGRHVPRLFKRLFGIGPRVYTTENITHCRMYCKKLVRHLHKRFHVPLGNKMGRLHIQKEILYNRVFLRAYLRGLFDTDGSIYEHRPNDAMLEYSIGHPVFLHEVKNALRMLGYSASVSRKSVYLYSKKDVDRFFAMIRPSNKKHVAKYKAFLKTGRVPRKTDLLKGSVRFIKEQKGIHADASVI